MPKASFYHLRFQLSQKLSVFFFVCRYYTMKLRTVKKKWRDVIGFSYDITLEAALKNIENRIPKSKLPLVNSLKETNCVCVGSCDQNRFME